MMEVCSIMIPLLQTRISQAAQAPSGFESQELSLQHPHSYYPPLLPLRSFEGLSSVCHPGKGLSDCTRERSWEQGSCSQGGESGQHSSAFECRPRTGAGTWVHGWALLPCNHVSLGQSIFLFAPHFADSLDYASACCSYCAELGILLRKQLGKQMRLLD